MELSRLDPAEAQRELMGEDIALKHFALFMNRQLRVDIVDRITEGDVSRTVEGASTLTVKFNDYDRLILKSGILSNKLDVQVDGLWWRMTQVQKQDDDITLTFMEREIALLKSMSGKKTASRQHTTRAEFIINLVREIQPQLGQTIQVVSPAKRIVQPIASSTDLSTQMETTFAKALGISGDEANNVTGPMAHHTDQTFHRGLTCKGDPIDQTQLQMANIILDTAHSMGAPRRIMVCAMMTAIVESTLHNYADKAHGGPSDADSAGLFQQRPGWGTYEDRHDPATSTRLFILAAIKTFQAYPRLSNWEICANTQRPREDLRERYANYETEAEKFVTAYGVTDKGAAAANGMGEDNSSGASYIFYRGDPSGQGNTWKPENSWDCIQRLADEVNWRAFFVSGVFYYLNEDALFCQKPIALIKEHQLGLSAIDGDYDINKKSATVTITARIGRWAAPPGSVIQLVDMGPWNGRWLVSQIDRSLFDAEGTITLKKPRPVLPEPQQNDVTVQAKTWNWSNISPTPPASQAVFGGVPGMNNGDRNSIVKVAERASEVEQKYHYHYLQYRPYADSLWSAEAHSRIDCSSFATLVYKEAGMPDPNNSNYNGQGYTGTLTKNGMWVDKPSPGDLVFYGGNQDVPGHVAVFVGNNQVIEIGSDKGILKVAWNYRPVVGIKSYGSGGALPGTPAGAAVGGIPLK